MDVDVEEGVFRPVILSQNDILSGKIEKMDSTKLEKRRGGGGGSFSRR